MAKKDNAAKATSNPKKHQSARPSTEGRPRGNSDSDARRRDRATSSDTELIGARCYRVKGRAEDSPLTRVLVGPTGLAVADGDGFCREYASLEELLSFYQLEESDLEPT